MRFVIIASPRTGSSHLVNMLGGHPEILCNGNLYHPDRVWVFWPNEDLDEKRQAELEELRRTAPFALLEHVFSISYGRPHVGFKIFQGQNDDVLRHLIETSEVKKIVLYRENVLANYASKLAARQTGKWGVREGAGPSEPPKIDFHAKRFASFAEGYRAFYKSVFDALLQNRQTFHLINYTDINNPYHLYALLAFIGADPLLPIVASAQTKRQVKQNSSNIVSRFSNPDVVRKYLRKTGNLHWMHEGELSFDGLGAVGQESPAEDTDPAPSAWQAPVASPG